MSAGMFKNSRIPKQKAETLDLAETLENISAACKTEGISRQTFYRWRRRMEAGGYVALIDRKRLSGPRRPRDPIKERTLVDLSLSHPTWSATRVAGNLRDRGLQVSVSGIRLVWLRHNLRLKSQRVAAASAREVRAPQVVGVHGVFRIGGRFRNLPQIKGLGIVVQHTFVETKSLLVIARVYPAYPTEDEVAERTLRGIRFIKEDILPYFDEKQISFERIDFARSWEIVPGYRSGRYKDFLKMKTIGSHFLRSDSDMATHLRRLREHELNDFLLPGVRAHQFRSVHELQARLDDWLRVQNEEVKRCGPPCFGRTAMETFRANVERTQIVIGGNSK
jgi:transposase